MLVRASGETGEHPLIWTDVVRERGRELSSEVLVESLSVPFGSLGADEPSGASFSTAEASAVVVAVSSFGGMLASSALG